MSLHSSFSNRWWYQVSLESWIHSSPYHWILFTMYSKIYDSSLQILFFFYFRPCLGIFLSEIRSVNGRTIPVGVRNAQQRHSAYLPRRFNVLINDLLRNSLIIVFPYLKPLDRILDMKRVAVFEIDVCSIVKWKQNTLVSTIGGAW